MQNKTLHIISFDNPFPPNYGGVIEVFYKIKALHEFGYNIHLHCFVDNIPEENSILNQYVAKVYYYKNKKSLRRFFSFTPYSVNYRDDKKLLANLKQIEAPILFESLKTTFLLRKNNFSQKIILRLHNIEHQYFLGIAQSEPNIFLKIIFYIESLKYKKYESIINKFDNVSTLSHSETNYISKKFNEAVYIPLFHGNEIIKDLSSFGDYAIYNGDLNTADNRKAVLFLIDIFKEIKDYNLVIAATDKQQWVEENIKRYNNISFVKLNNFEHLKELLSMAHINIMVSFQESGTKLKVINALYNSRHCLVNKNMIDDSRVLDLCKLATTKEHFIKEILSLRQQPFIDIEKRKIVLNEVLNDKKNAVTFLEMINSTN